jgi:hypothetical protein
MFISILKFGTCDRKTNLENQKNMKNPFLVDLVI